MSTRTISADRHAASFEWGIAISAILVDLLTTFMPRADKAGALRGELRVAHMVLGLGLLVMCFIRLRMWSRGTRLHGNAALPSLISGWISALSVGLYLVLAIDALIGMVYGWSLALLPGQAGGGHEVLNRPIWLFSGYFHSAMGFSILILKLAIVGTVGYALLRYREGLLAAFSRPIGVQALLGLAISLFALSTFKSYDRGPGVVAAFAACCLVVWLLSRLRKREPRSETGQVARWPGLIVVLLVSLGLYGPYAVFRVSPFETVTQTGPAGVAWHAAPGKVEKLPPETAFERQVRAETFKWCAFCHTLKKGGQHLTGPNLYGVYGQRMASAPNFAYGQSLKTRGEKGEVWDDAKLDAFLANPDKFAPGTTMVISSGNVTDPARRKALINILKRETGSAAP